MKLSRSSDRNSFQKASFLKRRAESGRTPDNDDDVRDTLNYFDDISLEQDRKEIDPEWQKNNMEYDLRATDWILTKVRSDEVYSQNLYAAMCNNEFQKLETWPLLKGQTYSCSWRYAGGIIADMREEGDYIDWYCSGITNSASEDELAAMTEEQRAKYYWYKENFVGESVVTDEICEDLAKLGWKVIEQTDE